MNDLHAGPDRTRAIESIQKKLTEFAGTVMPAMRRQYRAAATAARHAWRSRSKRTLRF